MEFVSAGSLEQQWAKGSWRARYLGNYEVAVVQRGIMKVDEDVLFTQCRDLSFVVEFEAIEAVFAFDRPLLGCCWCHDEKLNGF